MKFRHVTSTVAALVAATVLSACGSSVSGEASSPSTRSVTPKAATATGATPQLSGPGPVGELQDVTGQGRIWHSTRDDARYAPSPEPGGLVSTANDGCTLGPAIKAAGRAGFLIANHCVKGGQTQYARVDPAGANPLALGPAVDGHAASDSAVIWTETAADDVRVAGKWPVRGSLSVDQVDAIPVDAPICMNAAISGVICGGKIASGETGVAILKPVESGDSGSGAFVVDAAGGAWIVGVLSTGTSTSIVMPVEPMLKRLHASVITA